MWTRHRGLADQRVTLKVVLRGQNVDMLLGREGTRTAGRGGVWREEMRPRQQLHPRDQSGRRGRFWGTAKQGPWFLGPSSDMELVGRQSSPHHTVELAVGVLVPARRATGQPGLFTQEQGWNQMERGGAPEKPTGRNQK